MWNSLLTVARDFPPQWYVNHELCSPDNRKRLLFIDIITVIWCRNNWWLRLALKYSTVLISCAVFTLHNHNKFALYNHCTGHICNNFKSPWIIKVLISHMRKKADVLSTFVFYACKQKEYCTVQEWKAGVHKPQGRQG